MTFGKIERIELQCHVIPESREDRWGWGDAIDKAESGLARKGSRCESISMLGGGCGSVNGTHGHALPDILQEKETYAESSSQKSGFDDVELQSGSSTENLINEKHCRAQSPDHLTKELRTQSTPLPWFQFSIVLFLQLAEPLTAQVIYPFTPQLMRDLGVTKGVESRVGYYVGLMQSIFFLTQAFTVLHWSRLSDRIGRKPVIISGLFGLSMSMYCFGLSKTFWGLVFSRCLNGALNGNVGVIKSMTVEMTNPTNISKAYAYMPIAWAVGGTLGPMIGGLLSRPTERFPELFGQNKFLLEYPYFLPCAVPATFSLIALTVTFFYLEETLPAPIPISHIFKKSEAFLENTRQMPLATLLTPRVILAAGNYAALSLVDICYRAVMPLFYSTPVELGGLGLPPATIGKIMSCFGILNGIFQVFFFARIHDRWGSKRVFMSGIGAAFPVFLSFPIINYLAMTQGMSYTVWAMVAFQVSVSILLTSSYGAIFIFISAASPNRSMIGATNGLSQLTVSLMRSIGPSLANSLFSLSIASGYLGGYLVYCVLLSFVAVAMMIASLLPSRIWSA